MKIICWRKGEAILKSDNALLDSGEAFYLPEDCKGVKAEFGLAVRISHIGKSITARQAHNYYDRYSAAVSLEKITERRDALSQGFDYSFVLGKWQTMTPNENPQTAFRYSQNADCKEVKCDIADLFGSVIEMVSASISLKVGDVVFVALGSSTDFLNMGDRLQAELDERRVLECEIK